METQTKKDPGARGRWAEGIAREFLMARGLEPLCENYRFRGGEIDLVMRDGETIVFVEVRYRRSPEFGGGAESVTAGKQKRVIATALHYLQHRQQHASSPCRFDVIAISDDKRGHDVEWIAGAFDA